MLTIISDNPSIDKGIASKIILNNVSGSEQHLIKCKNYIDTMICDSSWRAMYTNNAFIYLRCLSENSESIELQFLLSAQIIEILYYFISLKYDFYISDVSFERKIRVVHKYYYGWNMPIITAQAANILRNRVAHTGTVYPISGMRSSEDDDKKKINKVHRDYFYESDSKAFLLHFARDINYLVGDMVVRALGLRQSNHLSKNLTPAWYRKQFGYIHGKTDISRLDEIYI